MSLANRIRKLEEKLKPKNEIVQFIGWANCTWSIAEGLVRYKYETKDDFLNRVRATTNKKWIWVE